MGMQGTEKEAMVLATVSHATNNGHCFEPAEHAKQSATVLREEFGVPFALYDLASGQPVWGGDEPGSATLPAATLAELAEDRRARVTFLPDGCYQIALVLHDAGAPIWAAAAELSSLIHATGHDADRERGRLEKWVQAVSDRLRLADEMLNQRAAPRDGSDHDSAAGITWEAILTLDHLIRRMRIHKEPAKNQQRILDAVFRLFNVQTLIWAPQQGDLPFIIQGEPILTPPDIRALASCLSQSPDHRPLEPLICNDLEAAGWAARFPRVRNLLAFQLTDQGPIGWIIAINKSAIGHRRSASAGGQNAPDDMGSGQPVAESRVQFRKSDAALLTAYVALLELHARASGRYQDLKELLVGLTRSLTAALDAKDSYTYGHSERVARIAVELGRELGLQGDELSDIYLAGLLHDVGKIGIRDSVLGKVEPLTVEEFEHIKQHVTIGYAILSDLRPIRNLLPGVLYHHEHFDGNGYPDGLTGEAIPLLARILAVADAYDAMSTNRPYRDAMPCRKVEEILVKGADSQWDKRVVDAFLRCRQRIHTIRQRGVGDSLQMAIDGALRIDRSSLQRKSDPALR
jgi:HD-GYP domain-containing protein (c-di-GMP phosphodiesterase class II)